MAYGHGACIPFVAGVHSLRGTEIIGNILL